MKKYDLVFVYGTLRTGERMDLGNGFYGGMCRHISDDAIKGDLYHLGGFPGVKIGDTLDNIVHGEVFEILDDHLPNILDSYEGFPNLYGRSQVETLGSRIAWVYTYNGRVSPDMLIVSGDWKCRDARAAA